MSDAGFAERPFELLENIPAGIIVIDPRGNVIYANPRGRNSSGSTSRNRSRGRRSRRSIAASGATRMYTIAATLEANAKSGDLGDAAAMIEELTVELDRATEALVRSGASTQT